MRILMLGNSFTYFNDLPGIIASKTGWHVESVTKGGAFLSMQLNPEGELGMKTLPALRDEKWDYVVLQEQSNAPITKKEGFMDSARALCELIRKSGAVPVFYATWAYLKVAEFYAKTGLDYESMAEGIESSYAEAAKANGGLEAKVGRAFLEYEGDRAALYTEDGRHPSAAGSELAADVIIKTIKEKEKIG